MTKKRASTKEFRESNFALWEEVEMEMAIWCYHQENTTPDYTCECISAEDMQKYDPKALNRLLKALEEGTYQGDELTYLEPQN